MRAFDNGAVGFLSKPFDEDALIECLNAAIRLQVAQAQ
jgi:FixJ family two-component response regulator